MKAIALKEDFVVDAISMEDSEYVTIFTNQNTAKRVKYTDLEETGRAKRGGALIKKVKSVNYEILGIMDTFGKSEITYVTEDGKISLKNSEIPIMDLASTGSAVTKKQILYTMKFVQLISLEEKKEEIVSEKEEPVQFTLEDFKL